MVLGKKVYTVYSYSISCRLVYVQSYSVHTYVTVASPNSELIRYCRYSRNVLVG